MIQKLINFITDEDGATAVEYGIMVAAIAAVIIGVVIVVGGKTKNAFEEINGSIDPISGGS